MLAKKFRLPIQQFTQKISRTLKGRYFLVKVFRPERPFSRFGIIISSKVSKKAVDRNRLKRQFFNFIRIRQDQLPVADYLIIALPASIKIGKDELQNQLFKCLMPNSPPMGDLPQGD